MATFVVETYLSAASPGEPDSTIERATAAVWKLAGRGHSIAFVRSVFLPDDETCLLLYEADDMSLVRAATKAAGLDPDRISRADDRAVGP